MPDPHSDLDWIGHWRALVEARQAQVLVPPEPGYWDKRAPSYNASVSARKDGVLGVLEPWLSPTKTLIDAGAGTGRHAAPLADRLDWVTAVEPSVGMRELIPSKPNLTVIGSGWEEAEVAPADLVICCHVLYFLADPLPFIEKLEASARERVFICLRYGQLRTPSDPLWELMTGTPRARQPQFSDLYNLLLAMGIQADVDVIRYDGIQRYVGEEAFVAEYSQPLGERWDQAKAADWMRANVQREADGGLVYGMGETVSGVAHWRPR